ncbi:MAG: HAMP domain-containing histidine kinase [Micrococcales bacterium]|nr:HAMP domain-containing histidine kinase [Micrococcales bacterium]
MGLATATVVAAAVVLLGVPLGLLVFRRAQPNPWPAVSLVLLACLTAVLAGLVVGSWQVKRLAKPLVYLAATAEQLGSGHLTVKPPVSGVEEIDLVTEELTRSADKMATRLAVERQFAADASHQLRTPLTALSLRLEEIELVSDQEEVRQEARIALEQIDRLGTTIKELLDRTRGQEADAGHSAVPLRPVLVQQTQEWLPAFQAAGRPLVLEIDGEPVAIASIGALTQVVATLLENSLKHGAGTTWMRGKTTAGGVAIEVEDQGPGVSPELASRIFERNVTGGGGTGLGLAVARDLVVADGGRLELSRRQPPVFTIFFQSAT